MKKFDAYSFLRDYNLPISTHGKNVGRNFIGTSCPFCGDDSDHMGFHITQARNPHCFRCGSHSLWDTIKALTGTNPKEIMEKYSSVSYIQEEVEVKTRASKIVVPGNKEFKPAHKRYLSKRKFDPDYLIQKYDLRVTGTLDKYSNRIIFPVYYNKRIVSYQGRTYTDSIPKYLTCHPDDEIVFHKDIFFNWDNAKNDTVLVVEGVFDAVRIGDNAIASFGTSITMNQINLLKKFNKVFFLYDPEELAQKKALMALTLLSSYGILCERISIGDTDPGDLSDDDAIYLKKELGIL